MSKKGIGTFIVGAAIGTGVGILLAPKKGSETRQDIKKKACEVKEKVKSIKKEDIKAKLQELKNDLKNLDKETAATIIKEKANALMKKADELITTAKEKSAPVIEKAAAEIKAKTVVILKNAVDKLEDDAPKNQNKGKNTKKVKAA